MKLPKKLPEFDALSPTRRAVADALDVAFGAVVDNDLRDHEAAERVAQRLAEALRWFALNAPVSDTLMSQLKLAANYGIGGAGTRRWGQRAF